MTTSAEALAILCKITPSLLQANEASKKTVASLLTLYYKDPCPCSDEDKIKIATLASLVEGTVKLPPSPTPHLDVSHAYTELQKHITGKMTLTAEKIITYLGHLNGLSGPHEKIADLVKGLFWELGGKQTPPGRDWVVDSIAQPDKRQILGLALHTICPLLSTEDTLQTLLSIDRDIPAHQMKQAICDALGPSLGAIVFSSMYKDHMPKVAASGYWEDEHIGKMIYRPLLRRLIENIRRPAAGGAGGLSLPSAAAPAPGRAGMRNETGNDCYLIAAWNLLRNVPRLRNQVLKNLPAPLISLKELAIKHLQSTSTEPLKGSRAIRTSIDALVGKSSGSRPGDAGETIIRLASTLSPELNAVIAPQRNTVTYRRDGSEIRSLELTPLAVEPSYGSFEASIAAQLGEHPNTDLSDPVRATLAQFLGPPPADLFVSVNRKNAKDKMVVNEHYTLPLEFATAAGPANYTLQAFIHWTGGHYFSFCKNADGSWTKLNDTKTGIATQIELDTYRPLASVIYYTRDDADPMDSVADNRWWTDATLPPETKKPDRCTIT